MNSHAGALVVIRKFLRDTVVPAGMPEPRHKEVKRRITQVSVEPPSYRPWCWIRQLLLRCSTSCIHAGMTTLKHTCV